MPSDLPRLPRALRLPTVLALALSTAACHTGPTPINGVCSPADGVAATAKPTTGLCSAGNASAVTGTGPWNWTCAGLKGGLNALCSAPKKTASSERGRVHVGNGTVLTDRNTILRGASMMILSKPGYANDPDFWRSVHDLGINAVRLDVKTVQIGKTPEEQLPYLDKAVDLAAENHMYIMFKTSVKAGGYDLAALKDFWTVAAPRYKNRTHVLYELTNEPVSGGPVWGDAKQWADKVIADLTSVYDIMRAGAPDTHIVLFTTPNLYPDCPSYKNVIAKMKGVDWTKASVAFHHYPGTEQFGEAGIRCLQESYPLMMDETNYWSSDGAAQNTSRTVLRLYEKLGMSWFSLDGKGSITHLKDEIIPDLHAQGYDWSVEK